jgi:hypothetical protein
MRSTIGDLAPTDKTEAIALVAPYVDTIEVSSRRPFLSPLLKLIAKNSGSMIPKQVHDKKDPKVIWYYLLAINQPSRYLIKMLQWYSERRKLSVYRFHLALDVIDIAEGYSRDDVIEVISKLLHLKHRRGSDDMHDENGTVYSIRVVNRKSRPQKNTAFYIAPYSKITGECDAIHFEIRLERKRAVQAADIDTPDDIFEIDPVSFVSKHLTAKDIRTILETIIQRSIDAMTPHPLMNAERRVRGWVRRFGLDHASTFAGAFPRQFERVKHWDCLDVEKTLNWATRDQECGREVGELCCLLPPKVKRERLDPNPRPRIVRLRL